MRLYRIFILIFFMIGCFPQESRYRAALHEEGEVILYLQTLPQQAGKLRFTIDEISAVRDDGSEIALALSFNEVKGADFTGPRNQRLLATGILPPGSYTGLSVRLEKALVQTEEGEVALLVPEGTVAAQQPFEIRRRQALALFLSLNASGTISGGISFTPGFSLTGPSRKLINLTGYVSNSASNIITVFNKKTMQVVGAIATGRGPRGIVLDQRRTRAYVAVSDDDAVEVFDVFTGSLTDKIRLSFGDKPVELALTQDGRTLVSVNHGSNTVSIIDAISLFELRKISVGVGPSSVTIDPSGLKAYIMNSLSNTVSVVDLTQRVATATIPVEGSPLRGDFNRAGNRLYVVSKDSPNLSVIDPSRFRVVERIFVGAGAVSVKVDVRTGLILVGNKFGNEIAVVDPSTFMFVDSIQVRGNAAFMTIDREENTLFVALPDRRALQKINLTSKKSMAEIEMK